MSVVDDIMGKAFEDEVVATIRDKLKDKYIDVEIEVFVNKFKQKKDELPAEIRQI